MDELFTAKDIITPSHHQHINPGLQMSGIDICVFSGHDPVAPRYDFFSTSTGIY